MEERLCQYEELLLKREELEKQCEVLYLSYLMEFGQENVEILQNKLECVKLKKTISICVRRSNRGETIYEEDLEGEMEKAMAPFYYELEERKLELSQSKGIKLVSEDLLTKGKLKKLYRFIAHAIHPDLHPEYIGDGKMEALWLKAVDAYKAGDELTLSRIKDEIMLLTLDKKEIEIEMLQEKILLLTKEIEEVFSSTPYTYKYLLEDGKKVEETHRKNKEEILSYGEYKESLKEELSKFKIVRRGQA